MKYSPETQSRMVWRERQQSTLLQLLREHSPLGICTRQLAPYSIKDILFSEHSLQTVDFSPESWLPRNGSWEGQLCSSGNFFSIFCPNDGSRWPSIGGAFKGLHLQNDDDLIWQQILGFTGVELSCFSVGSAPRFLLLSPPTLHLTLLPEERLRQFH